MAVTDHPDFGSEAEMARQISITGVPLTHLSMSTLIENNAALAISGSDVFTATFAQVSYDVFIDFYNIAGAPNAAASLLLEFEDSGTGFIVGRRRINVWPGNAIGDGIVLVHGPTRGDTIKVTLTNNATNVVIAYRLLVLQNSRPRTTDKVKQRVFASTTSGLSLPSADIPANILASFFTATLWTTGTQLNIQLPLYLGLVQIYMNTSSGTTDGELQLQDNASPQGLQTSNLFDGKTDANGNLFTQLYLGSSQVRANATNHNAATKSLRLTVVAAEQV